MVIFNNLELAVYTVAFDEKLTIVISIYISLSLVLS